MQAKRVLGFAWPIGAARHARVETFEKTLETLPKTRIKFEDVCT